MRHLLALLVAALAPIAANADVIVPAHTLRAKTVISASDLLVRDAELPGVLADAASAIGMETRVTLYAGRPIRAADLRQPAIIARNQIVTLHYRSGSLSIKTEARALDRAAPGEIIKVMNLTSKATLAARVLEDGSVIVLN